MVNCAAIVKGGVEYRIENFSDVVNVNLMGLLEYVMKCCLNWPLTRGNIINLSSVNTRLASSTSPAYASTKSGIEALTRSMACWAVHNVRVNSVAPDGLRENL